MLSSSSNVMDLVRVAPQLPADIYPLDVWELILEKLSSPSDLLSCNRVCKAWRKLLELKKTTFLMPKVFPILYKYLETVEAEKEEDEEDENEEENETTITTILKMRLVSQGWKESVDGYHQNHPFLNEIGFTKVPEVENLFGEYIPFPLSPSYDFVDEKSLAELECFLGKGFSTGSNPFITRYVKFFDTTYSNEQRQSRLNAAFRSFLEAFGSHIWTCDLFCTTRPYENKADFYRIVRSYLSLMPNLRSLHIQLSGNWKSRKDSEKEELELLLQNEPLPLLEHLTKLEMSKIPYPLSAGLLAANGHLQKLGLLKDDYSNDGLLPDNIVNVQLPSLKQLALNCFEEELFQLPKLSWPIKALHLTIPSEKEEVLKSIFLAVSSTFGNTLEHIFIDHWNANNMENNAELEQTRLELPKLRIFQLKIEFEFELETIDFLEGCPALQEIQLAFKVPHKGSFMNEWMTDECSYMDDDDDEEDNASSPKVEEDNADSSRDEYNAVIKFKDCITSMNQSNIWQVLTMLQTIKITTNGVEGIELDRPLDYGDRNITVYPDKTWKFTRRQFEKFCNGQLPTDGVPD